MQDEGRAGTARRLRVGQKWKVRHDKYFRKWGMHILEVDEVCAEQECCRGFALMLGMPYERKDGSIGRRVICVEEKRFLSRQNNKRTGYYLIYDPENQWVE